MNQNLVSHARILILFSVLLCSVIMVNTDCAVAQDFVVIANKSLGTSDVSAADIGNMFLGKKTTWDSGEAVVFAVFDDNDVQDAFLKEFVKKTSSQFNNFWKKMVFTGKGSMPKYLKSREDVLAFVQSSPGAISFIPAPGDDSVKTLTVK